MKILIVYGTIEGQTRKITRFMEEVLQDLGHKVVIADATDEPPSPGDHDAVLIGSSIHMQKYNPSVIRYVSQNLEALNTLPSAFFSISMAIASKVADEQEAVQKITDHFLDLTGWKPRMTVQIAGALKYTQYDFFKRLVMKMISKHEGGSTDTSRDHEYTDWDGVKKFLNEFLVRIA